MRSRSLSTPEHFEGLRSEYNGTKATRFRRRRTGLPSAGAGADWHYRSEADYLRLIEFARDMDRNDLVIGQMVDRATDNIVQDGFTLQFDTGDPKVDADLSANIKDYMEDKTQCDVEGEKAFADFEWLIMRHQLVDGDILVLPLEDGTMQLVEGHRLRSPSGTKKNVVHGILLSDAGKRLQYWITKDDLSPTAPLRLVGDVAMYPADQVMHVYDAKRASQRRGVTAFAPIFDTAAMLEDIMFAKLVQQQVASCFVVMRERLLGFAEGEGSNYDSSEEETLAGGKTRRIDGIAPGLEMAGAPGEVLKGFSPNIPNAEYFQQARMAVQMIGVNLGLPLVIALMDASETNFSGWRGAFDQARLGWKRRQTSIIRKFHEPFVDKRLVRLEATDPILARAFASKKANRNGYSWTPKEWPYIQPLEEAKAETQRLENNLQSPRRLHAERGRSWRDVSREIVEDRKAFVEQCIVAAEAIVKAHPEADVTWRDLAGAAGKAQAKAPVPGDGDGAARGDGGQGTGDGEETAPKKGKNDE